jgi:hypothetical protein
MKKEAIAPSSLPENQTPSPRRPARVAAEVRGSHRDILIMPLNCSYLEKRVLGKR